MLIYTTLESLDLSLPGPPKIPSVVAYLRSQPSAGAASDEAMSIQRELLAEMTSKGKITVVAEFVEVEDDSDDRPAYHAAYREAASRGCTLLTAGWGAIGTGPWFRPPNMPGTSGVETMKISVSYVRFPDLILTPQGPPASVALWADCRRPQGVTAVYLCNAGPAPMEAIELTSILRELGMDEGFDGGSRTLEPIPAGMAQLVTTLFHNEWMYYSRYYLSYASCGLPQEPLKATDGPLNSEWLTEDPSKVWVAFRPAAPNEAIASVERLAALSDAIEQEEPS